MVGFLRALPGYMLALMLVAVGIAMMLMAWTGWSLGINWYWALGALVLSAVARFNAFLVVGAYFFAREYLNWDQLQALAFGAIGFLFITPGVVRDIGIMLTGKDPTGKTQP